MKTRLLSAALLLLTLPLAAQVPNLLSHQGRVAVNGVNFDGSGQFKFALVNAAGSVTYWSNDGTGAAGSQPAAAVTLTVTKGVYSVLLGDTSLPNMTVVPASAFTNADLRLRVWFNNGVLGFQQLTPDQRLAPNGYLPDGAVTSGKLAPGATAGAVMVTGTSQAAAVNTSYVTTAATDTTFTLPATANVGDTIRISAAGAGGWIIPGGDNFSIWTPRDSVGRWMSVASSADGTKLVAGPDNGPLYVSTDSGVTWTPRGVGGDWRGIALSADGTKVVAVSLGGKIYTSSDSGVTWTPRTAADQLWLGVASSADGIRLAAAEYDGQIHTSSDSGVTWTPRGDVNEWAVVTSSADGSQLYAYTYNGGVARSDDYGATWSSLPNLGAGTHAAASSANADRLAVAAPYSPILLSTDGWQTQTQRELPRDWRLIACSADGSHLVAGVQLGRLYTSSDFGETWNVWESDRLWTSVASSANGRKLVAVAFNGRIYTCEGLVAFGLSGSEGILQYAGGGQWRLAGSPQGAITGGQLANRAVARDHLADDIGVWRVSASGSSIYRNEGEYVGIGTAAPRFPLSFGNTAFGSVRVALYDSGFTAPIGIGATSDAFRLQVNAPASRFVFGIGNSGAEILTIKGTGQVGIGTTSPNHPLSLGAGISNTKLALWDGGGSPYGLGIGSGQFRLHVDQPSARFSFLDAPAGNEIMTVTGTGQVGIGTATPNYPLSFGTSVMNTKLALWDGGPGGAYGLGIAGYQFRLHVDAPSARFSFLDAPAGNEVMTVKGTGNVGIGTIDPATPLHVRSSADTEISVESMAAGGRRWTVQSSSGNFAPLAGSFQIIDRTGGVARMVVMPNGNTGFSRAPAANRLEIEGDASKTTAGAWLANSDRRIKTDIQPVTGALETIDKVQPVTFRYTEEYRKAHPDIKDVPYYNVVAQEFREVFPNAVKSSGEKLPDGSEILQVDTYPATITALAAIKELKAENEALKRRLAALEEKVSRVSPATVNVNVNAGGAK